MTLFTKQLNWLLFWVFEPNNRFNCQSEWCQISIMSRFVMNIVCVLHWISDWSNVTTFGLYLLYRFGEDLFLFNSPNIHIVILYYSIAAWPKINYICCWTMANSSNKIEIHSWNWNDCVFGLKSLKGFHSHCVKNYVCLVLVCHLWQ